MSPLSHLGACLWSSGGSPLPTLRASSRALSVSGAQTGRLMEAAHRAGTSHRQTQPVKSEAFKMPGHLRPVHLPGPGVLSNSVHSGGEGRRGPHAHNQAAWAGARLEPSTSDPAVEPGGGAAVPVPSPRADGPPEGAVSTHHMTASTSRHPGTTLSPPDLGTG